MPGVGHEHARLDALGHRQHVAEQQFLGDAARRPRPRARPQCTFGTVSGCSSLRNADHSMPRPTASSSAPSTSERGRLEAVMTVGMVGVGVLLAVVVGEQHDEVRDQVRQRVDAVGDQALRLGQDADGDLGRWSGPG